MRSAMPRDNWASGEILLAIVRAPSTMGMVGTGSSCPATRVLSKFVKVACRWTAVGAPGADRPSHGLGRHPGNAKSSRPSADALAKPTEDGGPAVGHGYMNVKGHEVVTTP